MAKRECPFCKEKVKENATICKHCQSKLPALPPKKEYKNWDRILIGMGIIAILMIIVNALPSPNDSSEAPSNTASENSANGVKKPDKPVTQKEKGWKLLHRGRNGDRDVYYEKSSIEKVDDNISEVYLAVVGPENKHFIQQLRIDCKNKKQAIGNNDIYVNGVETGSMDFSRNGWVWNPLKNNVDKKVFNLVCTGKGN